MSVRIGRLSLGALLVVLAAVVAMTPALGIAASAQAHNDLVSSTPKAGETLTALPPQFVITTNDLLLNIDGTASGFALEVRDAAGKYYGDGCVGVAGSAMTMAAALGAAGKYTVTWQVVSTDGHTTSDAYEFTWQPTTSFTPSDGSTTAPDCNGTISPQSRPAKVDGKSPSRAGDSGALGTVLWIGGAFLAVALAIILTMLRVTRKRKRLGED